MPQCLSLSNRGRLISIVFVCLLLTQLVPALVAGEYALAFVDKKRVPHGSCDLNLQSMAEDWMFDATTSGIRLWNYPVFYKVRKVAKFRLPKEQEPVSLSVSPSRGLGA
ncbi:hypothetical protein KOR42_40760 [Thalassoglobus neptunius]|uniref:Uncharacterized protein n=1 Tax=Thalassoglobus neptunius TaxID=1938619 RepID=A0A5C5WE39_9PLAN|nr:hypothetical protein KOR42_40760 [Thalassoglobus neptunius]